uniref:Zinc finger MYM-type protein 1 n=1 Tax=Melanaphis sacchari TaxID=742174 RepID=A0A2H8TGB8_9HEMI
MSGKRIKLSGAEFRKRAEEKNKKDKLIISQTSKIQSFFKKKPESVELIEKSLKINQSDELVEKLLKTDDETLNSDIQVFSKTTNVPICPSQDPALWEINSDMIDFFIRNPVVSNPKIINFDNTIRKCGEFNRKLPHDIFKRKLLNGEIKDRQWLLYSTSKNALFCFYCLLFSNKKTQFSSTNSGFTDWKKCLEKVEQHEKNLTHNESIRIWFSRRKITTGIDVELKIEFEKRELYWRNIIHRLIETIIFLSGRGLAFRGNNETLGSKNNGNYLGCLELIAKFDPLMSKHLDEYGNKGRGNVSYLSHTICDELITLMNKYVLNNIVNEVTVAKYFSLIVDSTPDITKFDQLTIAIRYVNLDGTAVERFLCFIPSVGHKSKEMEVAILTKLTELDINISYCRGQSYDNARNMSGMYNGLQVRIKEKSKNAIFSPCSAHSLNLVGCHAADVTKEGYNFFSLAQNIYVFFAASTWRWEQLLISLKNIPNSMFVKNLCPTRWSSRFSVCKSLKIGFKGVLNSLKSIALNLDQKAGIRHEAESMYKKIDTLEFSFMIALWTPILERFDATSKNLQRINIDLGCVVKLYESLEMYIQDIRIRFDNILVEAKQISGHENKYFLMKKKEINEKNVFTMTSMFKKQYFTDKKNLKMKHFYQFVIQSFHV